MILMFGTMTTAVDASDTATPFVEVTHLYVNATPPTLKSTAAYMTLTNHTEEVLTFTGATSPAAERVELHQSSITNGMMKMRPVATLEIPPGGEVKLSPGGLHLMLRQLKRSLQPGEHVPITLLFFRERQLTVHAQIRDIRDQNERQGHPHHHH